MLDLNGWRNTCSSHDGRCIDRGLILVRQDLLRPGHRRFSPLIKSRIYVPCDIGRFFLHLAGLLFFHWKHTWSPHNWFTSMLVKMAITTVGYWTQQCHKKQTLVPMVSVSIADIIETPLHLAVLILPPDRVFLLFVSNVSHMVLAGYVMRGVWWFCYHRRKTPIPVPHFCPAQNGRIRQAQLQQRYVPA